jgi:16S rRNA (guanine1207-N2)-methyltransferase
VSRLDNRAADRDSTIADVAAEALSERKPQGRILVAFDSDGGIAQALTEGGAQVVPWLRLARK